MFSKLVFITILLSTASVLYSQVVLRSWMVDWTQAGLYEDPPPVGKIINITHPHYGATPNNDTDDDYNAIAVALDEASNQPNLTIIYFPPGNYHIYQPIVLTKNDQAGNVVFIGAGESTVLTFPSLKNNYPFKIAGNRYRDVRIDARSDLYKDDFKISVDPGELSRLNIKMGDWIHISEWTSPRMTDAAPEQLGQIFQIGFIVDYAGLIFLTTKASLDFKKDNGLCVIKMEPIKNVGIENMKIYRKKGNEKSHYNESSNVLFSSAVNCWIKGVHFNNTFEHHVKTWYSAHLEISGCYFNDAYYVGDGGYGYGVALGASTTMCLIENNIFRKLRHAQLVQDGANTNVFGYNYSREQEWKIYIPIWGDDIKLPDNTGQDLCVHGDYTFANLFEGNSVVNIWADDTHGRNGPYNTFLRNYTSNPRSDLTDAANFEKIEYVNFIGNTHIDNIQLHNVKHFIDIYTQEYPQGYPWEYYVTKRHNDNLGDYHFINDISYYYCDKNYSSDLSYKPEFLDGYDWPPMGPPTNLEYDEIIEYHDHQNSSIPAKDRWKNQSTKTYNSDPIITDVPILALPSEINSSSTISGIFEVVGTVIINNEATLTINAGTKLLMHAGSSILTESGGKIIANGSVSENIEFRRYDENQAWDKIELSSGGNRFSNCIIDGGTNNIYIKSNDNIINYCNISNAAESGILTTYINGTSDYSDYSLLNCDINNNRYGVYSYKSYGDIQSTEIHDNTLYGLRIAYSKIGDNSAISGYNQYFINNIIHDNGFYGIFILTSGILHSGSGGIKGRNRIINNGRHEIYLNGKSAMIYGSESTYGYELWSSIYDNANADAIKNKYILNYTKTPERMPITIHAYATYWGSPIGPSPNNFSGYYVDYSNYLTSDTSLFESPSSPGNFNYQMITNNDYDLISKQEISQTSLDKIEADQMNSMITNTKARLSKIRTDMINQKGPQEVNRKLYEYFRVYSSVADVDANEKIEIINLLKVYTTKLEKLSNYDDNEIQFLAENAAMQEIFILHNAGDYSGSLKLINDYEKYINDFDNRKELLSLKMDCFYTLGQYQQAYYTLKALKKHIYEDQFWCDIPTYEVFERELCEKLNIEYGILDRLIAEEYQTDQENGIPTHFALRQNYPNPFNLVTIIPFDLPENSYVNIRLYNVVGQLVATLADGIYERGLHKVKFNGQYISSGMYFITAEMVSKDISNEKHRFKQKILLLK